MSNAIDFDTLGIQPLTESTPATSATATSKGLRGLGEKFVEFFDGGKTPTASETTAQASQTSTEQPPEASSSPDLDQRLAAMESRFDRLESLMLGLAEQVQAMKPASSSGIRDV